ncbi:bifunctional adenosylcobinamide kinase/adenosylcobinamide-phosphate guanylyltransferase [Chitinibacteraceae bacterium HSL-7]
MQHLITGGARSGKSRYAETLALDHPGPVVYVATAELRDGDAEFATRVAHHRARRPAHWQDVGAGLDLGAALRHHARSDALLLVDCLTLWLVRFLEAPEEWASARSDLLAVLPALPGQIVLVSNELGCGVVPLGEANRWFVDELGRLNQDVAACCSHVTLVACGLPLVLKQPSGSCADGSPV